ncbi:hypothetical protein [Pseudoalteromonas distincta]|uniref:hypothetical protein n=1 Tax=Pseudoalteromonas distincta TaxID=77608 RepID=UPI00241FB070|nr:hypothetical protein [Pseudoalteromonas distincta]|tara:strand:- start:1800 stop:2597 length:798 start_codon:yes stop_codon:yes gene_type:complete
MRVVVDSNYLQSKKLEKYLSKSTNEVILTDQVSYEAIGSDIHKSFEILSRHSEQVFVLKRTGKIIKQSLKSSGLQKRLIDEKDSKRFRTICKKIQNPHKRDQAFLTTLKHMKHEVDADLLRINNEAAQMGELMLDYFSSMSKGEAKELRAGPPYNDKTLSFILKRIEKLTIQLFQGVVNFKDSKYYDEFYNSYLFRSGVCGYFLAQEWYLSGGLKDVKAKKMMNDLLDVQIAAYATYFDGFFSNDKKAIRIYKISDYFIKETIKT